MIHIVLADENRVRTVLTKAHLLLVFSLGQNGPCGQKEALERAKQKEKYEVSGLRMHTEEKDRQSNVEFQKCPSNSIPASISFTRCLLCAFFFSPIPSYAFIHLHETPFSKKLVSFSLSLKYQLQGHLADYRPMRWCPTRTS